MRDSRIHYVLSLSLDPALMKELLDRQKLPPEWRGTITDGNGSIIARTRLHDEFLGKSFKEEALRDKRDGARHGTDLEGRAVIWGSAPRMAGVRIGAG